MENYYWNDKHDNHGNHGKSTSWPQWQASFKQSSKKKFETQISNTPGWVTIQIPRVFLNQRTNQNVPKILNPIIMQKYQAVTSSCSSSSNSSSWSRNSNGFTVGFWFRFRLKFSRRAPRCLLGRACILRDEGVFLFFLLMMHVFWLVCVSINLMLP